MSLSRWAQYQHKLSLFRTMFSWLAWTSIVLFVGTAHAQIAEMNAAGKATVDALKGSSLPEVALYFSGACVAALVYGLRLAYAMHVEQVRQTVQMVETVGKLSENINRLTDELRSRPCQWEGNK